MKDMLLEKRKSVQTFISQYAKVTIFVLLLLLGFLFIYFIFVFISPQKLRVSFLDVGQGDAILIQTPSGKSMLIDGGPNNLISTRLSERMNYFNRDIDVVVATHPDADHITGLISVLEKYKIHTIIISKADSDTDVSKSLEKSIIDEQADIHVAHTGDTIDFHDGVVVSILYPDKNYIAKKSDTNDVSVSVVIKYGDESFLLTGDLPEKEESNLLQEILPRHVTVYKAGHHGSKYSSGEKLLSYIKPEYAIISAGKDNRYGHPNIETLDRLKIYAKEIISTIDRGTISFITDGRMMEIKTSR